MTHRLHTIVVYLTYYKMLYYNIHDSLPDTASIWKINEDEKELYEIPWKCRQVFPKQDELLASHKTTIYDDNTSNYENETASIKI